ncbi:MAG: ComEA family DNA-binding protein [Bacteroidia bacterium]
MQNSRNNLFQFTRRERRALAVLAGIIALLCVWHFSSSGFAALPEYNYAAFDKLIAANSAQPATDSAETPPQESMYELAGEKSIYHRKEKFYFDPNNLPEDKWVRLGLSPAQARSVKKFEASGGKFRYRQDVKKLIVVSPELYIELEPYIALPDEKLPDETNVAGHSGSSKSASRIPQIIELNAADTAALVKLEGIGPVFARRIVAYRQKLGGFYSSGQLLEVFGFDQERLDLVAARINVDSAYIRKINVNTARTEDLRRHPYFTPVVAKALVSYRNSHGPFRNLPDVMRCQLFTPELYRKLAPYLTI